VSLRTQARNDARAFLNARSEFAWPISVRNPSGLAVQLCGYSNDIGETIDPDTGQAVSGRRASVALHIADCMCSGLQDIPRGISDPGSKPWIVTFDDILGHPHTFKVMETMPDRTIGIVVCMLEIYLP
jgi:hypothetical protein